MSRPAADLLRSRQRRPSPSGVPRFAWHRLADVPGPHSVRAADLDGDGDVDLAFGNMATTGPMASWLEVWQNTRRATSGE